MITENEWIHFKNESKNNGALIEMVIKNFYQQWLNSADSAIDGGAHDGYHTIPLAQKLTNGFVVGIDANKSMIDKLTPRLEKFKNTTLLYAAIQDNPNLKTINFNCSKEHPGRSGISRSWDYIEPGVVKYEIPVDVNATTLDIVAAEHQLNSLRFIKLDLEGGEYNAIRGAESIMINNRPVFVCEHASQSPAINKFRIEDYFATLHKLGYIPMAPNGIEVSSQNPFPFWYIYLVPFENFEAIQILAIRSLQSTLASTTRPHTNSQN